MEFEVDIVVIIKAIAKIDFKVEITTITIGSSLVFMDDFGNSQTENFFFIIIIITMVAFSFSAIVIVVHFEF